MLELHPRVKIVKQYLRLPDYWILWNRVDGVVSAELGLQGKPEADIFTTAADNMGVTYDRAVVVEDAVSGVQAGKMEISGWYLG